MGYIQTNELQSTTLPQSTTLEIFLPISTHHKQNKYHYYQTNTPNLSKYGSRRSISREVPLQGQDRGLRHLRRRRRVRREVEDRQEHSPRSGRQLLQGVRQQARQARSPRRRLQPNTRDRIRHQPGGRSYQADHREGNHARD